MSLPFFKKSKPAAPAREYLLALEISHHIVKSAIWGVFNDRPQVLSVGDSVSWDDRTIESLLEAADQTLTAATSKLDDTGKILPEKVILGLPGDWIENEKISTDKLRLLKTLSQKLSLSAVGFVVTTDAVARYLQNQEGVPPTVILIGFWPQDIAVSLIKMGISQGTQLVKSSSHIAADVVEGLSRFPGVDMLPSRILLYDSGRDLESVRQTLLAHPWQAPQTRLPFLHFPKIEPLPPDFSITSIVMAGGTEVAQAVGLIGEHDREPVSETSVETAVEPEPVGPDAFGFIADSDIKGIEPTDLAIPIPVHSSPVATHHTPTSHVPPSKPRFPLRLPKLGFPKLSASGLPMPVLVGAILLAIIIGLGLGYWFLPTAKVTLYYESRNLPIELSAVADTSLSDLQLDPPAIPATTVEAVVSGEKSLPTTGSKLIGDRATGTVTVINGTSVEKSFPAGTVVTSPSGLQFSFDSAIQVASASGTADPNSYQPGSTQVKVTASQIGTDSNLSAGTQFKIGTFSSLDYVAKNDAAFSGGSSRSVKAVAAADISSLRSDLTSSLRDQSQSELTAKVGDTSKLISKSVSYTPSSETFSHKAGDEADNLSLKLTVTAKGLSINQSDLDALVGGHIAPQVPSGFIASGDYTVDFSVGQTQNSRSDLSLTAAVALRPQFDESQIAAEITGKTPSAAEDYLKSLPSISHVSMTVSPPLPGPLLTLPRITDKISLEFVPANP